MVRIVALITAIGNVMLPAQTQKTGQDYLVDRAFDTFDSLDIVTIIILSFITIAILANMQNKSIWEFITFKKSNGKKSNGNKLIHANGQMSVQDAYDKISDKQDEMITHDREYKAKMTTRVDDVEKLMLNEFSDLKTDQKTTSVAVSEVKTEIAKLGGIMEGMIRIRN